MAHIKGREESAFLFIQKTKGKEDFVKMEHFLSINEQNNRFFALKSFKKCNKIIAKSIDTALRFVIK